MCTLITSKATDIDENIANQNHATRTRTPKPGYLNLPTAVISRPVFFDQMFTALPIQYAFKIVHFFSCLFL